MKRNVSNKNKIEDYADVNLIEHFNLRDYYVPTIKESKIDVGKKHIINDHMKCPQCKKVQPVMEHWELRICNNCGLVMHLEGLGLSCGFPKWKKK